MSELKDKVLEDMEKEIELDKKEAVVKENRINSQFERIEQNKKELEIIQNSKFGDLSEEEINDIVLDNDEYFAGARTPMIFINRDFKKVVPFFRKNLILIGGKTGEGKSTTVANIVYQTVRQINPITGKRRRVMVITNEEKRADVYNRITCLHKGLAYTNHDEYSKEQSEEFSKMIRVWARNGVTVVDDTHGGSTGMTTTIEGIETIFSNMIRDGEWYDVIIIDYYQNIKASKKDIMLDEYKVQAKLAAMLDKYKNLYPAPIVIMAQVVPNKEGEDTPFEYRIKGRKVITDPATMIIELRAEREHRRTEWKVWKSRFTASVGQAFHTGFDKGHYVVYDNDFMRKVLIDKENAQKAKVFREMDKASGADLKEKQEKNDGKPGSET